MDYINFNLSTLNQAELEELIRHHDERYWQIGSTEISDQRYDELVNTLKLLDPGNQLITRIHTPSVASTGTVKHNTALLSLDKAYSLADVIEWANKFKRSDDELLLIEPKYDGISANFANGVLATRGDGYTGENISDKLPLIELESVGYTGKVNRPVRGEIIMRLDRFSKFQQQIMSKGAKRYKNPRNILTGLMTLKDSRDLTQVEYAMSTNNTFLTLVDYDLHSYPIKLGDLFEEWDAIIKDFSELPYPQDGVVVKFADTLFRESLGHTAHHPRGEIAFKFQNIGAPSVLRQVIWSFGKGCLTPVAVINPVSIGGTTITHATLHNLKNILDRDIQIGDSIVVERAGDVIPYIKESTPGSSRQSAVISHCPGCQSALQVIGPELCCTNPDCRETNLQKLVAAVKNIGIERLGEPVLRKMMEVLQVSSITDLFKLTKSDLLKLGNFADKSAENLLAELKKARRTNDFQLLASLNIPHVGVNMAKLLTKEYTLDELKSLSEEQLALVRGIGPERARSIHEELEKQKSFLDELLKAITVIPSKGKSVIPTICFTGSMPQKRSYYESLAAANHYECVDSVNASLSLLVAAELNSAGSKIEKARKLNIPIIQLDDWINELKNIPDLPVNEEPEQLTFF